MNPGLAQLIGVMLQFKQLRQQQDQFRETQDLEQKKFTAKEEGDHLDSMQKFITFVKSVPPESRQALIDMTSKSLGADPHALGSIAASFPTEPGTVAARLLEQNAGKVNGSEVASYGLTGHGMGENAVDAFKNAFVQNQGFGNKGLFDQFASRAMTEQGAGTNAVDTAASQLPEQDLSQAAKFQLQLGLTPWQVAQNLIQRSRVGVEQQNANTQGFEANTQRTGVNNQYDLGQKELTARTQGLYNGGRPRTAEDLAREQAQLNEVLSKLGAPLTPVGLQEMYKNLIRTHYAPTLGLDQGFLDALTGTKSPSYLDAIFRGGH